MANEPKTMMINDVEYVRKDQASAKTGPEVLVRTYSAGVHVGTLESREGKEVVLLNARRIWKWAGAFTLNEIATKGVDRKNSRICASTPKILLTEAIEILSIVEGVDLSSTEK